MNPRVSPPMPRVRAVAAGLSAGLIAAIAVGASSATAADGRAGRPTASAPATGATISGTVTAAGLRRGLYGMRVQAQPALSSCSADPVCGPQAVSGPDGSYKLTGLQDGAYTVNVIDGSTTLHLATLTVTRPTSRTTLDLTLPAPAVPAGTRARNAARDLSWLNAERARDGLPARVALNPRWSAECAAHDAYELANHVLEPAENPAAPGASAGGAWAGENSVLAQDRWTRHATPWENAPIHLLGLLAPSLSVVGVDDSGGLQCVTTSPGMLRAPGTSDVVSTYPGPGAHGVVGAELARESPFVPAQFAGLSATHSTGRELFVYLNRGGQIGQAPVDIVHASLSRAGHPVAVRWVDNTTHTLGPYLAGGIVIPVGPLHAGASYRATVAVRDGARTLTHAWSFTTR